MDQSGGPHVKWTARRRIEALLDGASFVELGALFEHTSTTPGFACVSAPGEGVVTGYGAIDGRPVYVFAQDASVLGGSMSRGHAEKIIRILDMALKNGAPVIGILDSAGARVTEGAAAMGAYNAVIKKLAELSGVVPAIAVITGPCIGAASVLPCLFDFAVAMEGTALSLHSPQVLDAAGGKTTNACQTGLAQFAAANEAEAFAIVRRLIGFLPQNNLEDAPDAGVTDDLNRLLPETDTAETVDARQLIAQIADNGNFLEAYAECGPGMVTGFIRLGGATAGVVANAHAVLTAAGCKKAARFISFLDAYHLPILTLADCWDTPPGTQEELLSALSLLAYAYAQTSAPMVTVVTGKAVGAGLLAMCPKSAGADIVYAWKDAVISALPPETGALIVYDNEIRNADDPVAARQEVIEKYKKEAASAVEAARQGLVDQLIEPSATRQMAIVAFEACASKRLAAKPPKKHGVRPL